MKFDRQEALHQATDLFWAKGFHATSMRTIQQAMDMRPGSIYASFGSKEALFKQALQYYAANSQARLAACVEHSDSPLAGLKRFITEVVMGCDQAPSSMCMLVKSITELTEDNAELLMEAKRLLNGMEQAFAEVLAQAQAQQQLSGDVDSTRLARYLQMQLMGLRAYVRANGDAKEHLESLIDDVFQFPQGES
ncbi:MAG: TetR/AcrR family transcriptional regulator [Pseudomonadota bacterium]|nr:TetR/AcrR family transcriptional regulator [Pseudomonadota bacterium]MEC8483710.1 TetR/AcrR family transcriptional regulator [Pseudomonadota bacterium]